jgi:hypothetical protein
MTQPASASHPPVEAASTAATLASSNGNGAAAANLAGTQDTPVWPEEVLAVAQHQQLRELLDPMLKATREIFPTASWIKIYSQTDYQDPHEKNIVFDVEAAGLDAPQARAARYAWIAEMHRLRPSPFIYHFLLLLRLV